MDGACSTHEKLRNLSTILIEKSEVKEPPGKPRPGGKDNIKMDLTVRGYEGMD
jgi:hypothetical protein